MKKGRTDEALRIFQAVYRYTDDNLKFIACVGEAYEKARNDPNLAQDQKETLYLKLQRIAGLTTRYTRVKGESAYNLGLVYSKKGDTAQAREYLIDACRTATLLARPGLGLDEVEGPVSQYLQSGRRVLKSALPTRLIGPWPAITVRRPHARLRRFRARAKEYSYR